MTAAASCGVGRLCVEEGMLRSEKGVAMVADQRGESTPQNRRRPERCDKRGGSGKRSTGIEHAATRTVPTVASGQWQSTA